MILIGMSGFVVGEDGGVFLIKEGKFRKRVYLINMDEEWIFWGELKKRYFEVFLSFLMFERKVGFVVFRIVFVKVVREFIKEFGFNFIVVDFGFVIYIKKFWINKGIGIEKVCEYLGILLKEVVYIGDGENDFDVFGVVGYWVVVV